MQIAFICSLHMGVIVGLANHCIGSHLIKTSFSLCRRKHVEISENESSDEDNCQASDESEVESEEDDDNEIQKKLLLLFKTSLLLPGNFFLTGLKN